jgi:1,4-alpha-glucan branching enzyme
MVDKKFLKSKSVCEVKFEVPEEQLSSGEAVSQVCLVGEFNGWDNEANPMKRVKGVWKTSLKLETEREYQYRYLVNGATWQIDWNADKYVSNGVDGDNSVVVTYSEN